MTDTVLSWVLKKATIGAKIGGYLTLATVLGFVGTSPAYAKTYNVLFSFAGTDGANPYASLVRDNAGNLYGTTHDGGDLNCTDGLTSGCGVVFMLDKNGKETVLHTFTGGADGAFPYSNLVRDLDGNLYGTTVYGGDLNCPQFQTGCGVAFKIDLKGTFSVLHTFEGGPDGALPIAGLTLDLSGNLYGTAQIGGDTKRCSDIGCGVVFMLDGTGNETVLHTFVDGADGSVPQGDLFRDKMGNLFGTTSSGGRVTNQCSGGCGLVFKLQPSGEFSVLHTFAGSPSDGAFPLGGLICDNVGNLYGTTVNGGTSSAGTVFRLRSHSEKVLYSFKGAPDGASPNGKLVRDKAGNLYGTTPFGGKLAGRACTGGCGTVFRVTKAGTEKILYTFNLLSGTARGGRPLGGVILDPGGNIYGIGTDGGDRSCKSKKYIGCGVVFRLTP